MSKLIFVHKSQPKMVFGHLDWLHDTGNNDLIEVIRTPQGEVFMSNAFYSFTDPNDALRQFQENLEDKNE